MSNRQHEWTYKQQGSEMDSGPVTESQFVQLVKDGQILASTLVRSPTRTKNKWVPVSRIPAVAKFIKQPASPAAPIPAAAPVSVQPTIVQPVQAQPLQAATVVEPLTNQNPYAAPNVAAVPVAATGPPKAAQKILEKFTPLNATILMWLLRVTMLMMSLNGIFLICFIIWGRRELPSLSTAQFVVVLTQLLCWVWTLVFLLRWKYQAYSNLQAACEKPLKTTAGWAIGVYFIPILNLFRPPMAMFEIQSRSKASVGAYVIAWWILCLLGAILQRVAVEAPGSDNKARNVVWFASMCLLVTAGYLLLKVIRTVTEKQKRYRLSLESGSN